MILYHGYMSRQQSGVESLNAEEKMALFPGMNLMRVEKSS